MGDIKDITLAENIGVYFNCKGNFSDNIKKKFSKAKQMAGYILWAFMLQISAPMTLLFKIVQHLPTQRFLSVPQLLGRFWVQIEK